MDEFTTRLMEFALPLYETRDIAHDAGHIRRILARAPVLSQSLPETDEELLAFLAVFHGLHRRVTADASLRTQTTTLLRDCGWDEERIEAAFDALGRHVDEPLAVEERIVHDANLVEILGAFGVAKAFTKGGSEGQSYEETIAILTRNLDEADFKTPEGRRAAVEGRQYVMRFLARLEEELAPGVLPGASGGTRRGFGSCATT